MPQPPPVRARHPQSRAAPRRRSPCETAPSRRRSTPEQLGLSWDVPGLVAGVDEAIAHINHYSSHHTDAIITRDHMHAQAFLREVDSASVMVNTSTRFADGFEFGLGAEIGISTDKFHARGPVGIEGLTSLKYVVLGNGEVRG